jgi:MFS family permease
MGQRPRKAKLSDYLSLLRIPSYVLNTAGMTAMTFAIGGISFWMPTYVHEFRGQPDFERVNTVFGGITVVTGLSATLAGGYLGDRLRARWSGSYFTVSGIGMLIGFPVLLLVLVTPFPWAWGLIAIAEFCVFLNTGPTNTILANVTHPSVRAAAFALTIFVIHALGDAISPPLIGWISGLARSAEHPSGNMNVGFVVVALTMLAAGVFWLLGAKYLQRDTELAPTRLGDQPAGP